MTPDRRTENDIPAARTGADKAAPSTEANLLATRSESLRALRAAALAGAVMSAVFCLIVSTMLIVNYVQIKTADPLNTPGLQALRQQFRQHQADDALKAEIRALDLLARKAFFMSQSQLRTGGILLLAGAAVGVALVIVWAQLAKPAPEPLRLSPLDQSWRERAALRRGVAVAGGLLLAAALTAWIGADRNLAAQWVVAGTVGVAEHRTDQTNRTEPAHPARSPAIPPSTREDYLRNWANFRGPDANGHALARQVPVRWNAKTGEGIKWKVSLPRVGYSSPIVWGQRLFVTAADKTAREIYGVDTGSGKLLWTAPVKDVPGAPTEVPDVDENTGLAAPTPATDGRRVYAMFGTGELLCVDVDGRPVWSRYLGQPENHYGHASSLIVADDRLIVQFDDASHPRVLALNTATGDTVWESQRSAISWASPICVDTGRRHELILCDSEGVEAYDPANGVSLWREACLGGEAAPSAAYDDGMVFAASDTAKACGLKITDTGVEKRWEWDESLPDTASLLAASGLVFMATSGGAMVCLKGDDGTVVWQEEFSRPCYASPILAEGRVYALDQDGVMHIFEAAGTFKAVATCPLGENAGATPAFADGRIYIRGIRNLYCVGE